MDAALAPIPVVTPKIPDPLAQDHDLVDRIIYLASLASNRQEIDPMMDSLRSVTAAQNPTQPLTPQAKATLATLEAKLQDYLISRDPLRSFTKETLAQRLLAQQKSHVQGLNPNARSLILVIVLAICAGLIGLLPLYPIDLAHRLLIAVPLFYTVLGIGTDWFYLTSLRNFRPELRRAFILLCIGALVMSLDFSHYALISLLDVGDLPAFRYGGLLWLVPTSFVCIYLGLRIYARMMGLKNRFMSVWTWIGINVALILPMVLAPHPAYVADEGFFDLSVGAGVVLIVTAIFGAGVARALMDNVTTAFTGSMRWIYRYMLVCVPGCVVGIAALFYLGKLNGQALNLEIGVFGLPPLLLLLYTGYSFKRDTGR